MKSKQWETLLTVSKTLLKEDIELTFFALSRQPGVVPGTRLSKAPTFTGKNAKEAIAKAIDWATKNNVRMENEDPKEVKFGKVFIDKKGTTYELGIV